MKTALNYPLAAAALSLLSVFSTAAYSAAVPGQGTWETTLLARDINGDGTVDAYFDTTRNVTWLADAKAIKGTSFDDGFNSNDGRATYASAKSWLAALDVYGVTGWRFPGADLVSMYGTTLGNSSIPNTPITGWRNTGPFLNILDNLTLPISYFDVSGWYWRGDTPSQAGSVFNSTILAADFLGSPIYTVDIRESHSVWAVKSGDVTVAAAIPEPSIWALMLLGVGALVCRQKRAA